MFSETAQGLVYKGGGMHITYGEYMESISHSSYSFIFNIPILP